MPSLYLSLAGASCPMCELFEAKVHSSPSGIEGSSPPITPLLTAERLPDLPFAHAFGRLPMTASDASLGVLLKDLDAVSGGCCSAGGGCAYNLAVADGWVLMVPYHRIKGGLLFGHQSGG